MPKLDYLKNASGKKRNRAISFSAAPNSKCTICLGKA